MKCFPCTNNRHLYEAIKIRISSVDMIFSNQGSKYSFHWSYHESISILSGWGFHNYITSVQLGIVWEECTLNREKWLCLLWLRRQQWPISTFLSLFFLSLIKCAIDLVCCYTHIYHTYIVNPDIQVYPVIFIKFAK